MGHAGSCEAVLEKRERERKKMMICLPDCNTALSQIKSLKIVKKMGDASGSWFKDPSEGSEKVKKV